MRTWAGVAAVSGVVAIVLVATTSRQLVQRNELEEVGMARDENMLAIAQRRVQQDLLRLKRTQQGLSSLSLTPEYRSPPHAPFGPNHKHCAGGNCENLDAQGVATDSWPLDVYRGIPNPAFDPEAGVHRLRHFNSRTGDFAWNLNSESYHEPVTWGVGGYEGTGTMSSEDKGAVKLHNAGVNHDSWPFDIYKAMPNPGWDKTEYDHEHNTFRLPQGDSLERIQAEQDSNMPLQDAGVTVNRTPLDKDTRTFNSVDGIYDKLVHVDKAPKWRQGGIAAQEQPGSFLLRENPDFNGPQPTEDTDLGVEEPLEEREQV